MNSPNAVPQANEAGPAGRQGTGFRREWAAHTVWILLAILVFAPTIYWLWQRWTMSVWNNVHGLFIPFIVAYFIREVLRSDQIVDAEQSAWGFLFLIPGLGMIVLDSAIRTQLLAAFGMVVCLPGLSLLLLGSRRTKALGIVLLHAAHPRHIHRKAHAVAEEDQCRGSRAGHSAVWRTRRPSRHHVVSA